MKPRIAVAVDLASRFIHTTRVIDRDGKQHHQATVPQGRISGRPPPPGRAATTFRPAKVLCWRDHRRAGSDMVGSNPLLPRNFDDLS